MSSEKDHSPVRCAVASGSAPFFSVRLDAINAKIRRGERITNNERAERQGIIFNHGGKPSGFRVV